MWFFDGTHFFIRIATPNCYAKNTKDSCATNADYAYFNARVWDIFTGFEIRVNASCAGCTEQATKSGITYWDVTDEAPAFSFPTQWGTALSNPNGMPVPKPANSFSCPPRFKTPVTALSTAGSSSAAQLLSSSAAPLISSSAAAVVPRSSSALPLSSSAAIRSSSAAVRSSSALPLSSSAAAARSSSAAALSSTAAAGGAQSSSAAAAPASSSAAAVPAQSSSAAAVPAQSSSAAAALARSSSAGAVQPSSSAAAAPIVSSSAAAAGFASSTAAAGVASSTAFVAPPVVPSSTGAKAMPMVRTGATRITLYFTGAPPVDEGAFLLTLTTQLSSQYNAAISRFFVIDLSQEMVEASIRIRIHVMATTPGFSVTLDIDPAPVGSGEGTPQSVAAAIAAAPPTAVE